MLKLWKEVNEMMAMLYAQAVMNGDRTFESLKDYWKKKVYPILVTSGCEDLAGDWRPREQA